MYSLFLETEAAEQIIEWADINDFFDTESLLKKAYFNATSYGGWTEDCWVEMCLGRDSHKQVKLASLFSWQLSPEGFKFWFNINCGGIV